MWFQRSVAHCHQAPVRLGFLRGGNIRVSPSNVARIRNNWLKPVGIDGKHGFAPFSGHSRDHDRGAPLGEPAHGRGADAASAAGDERRSVGQVQKTS